jgi:NTP pyrophosphatase (non-canonical NTP hydrolase)
MLNELAQQIHQAARDKGFWDKDRNIGELLMLIVSELSEALEADRSKRIARFNDYMQSYRGRNDYDPQKIAGFELHIKDSFEDEMADALIRILDLCAAKDIDIDWHVRAKLRYNETRPHKHGKAY